VKRIRQCNITNADEIRNHPGQRKKDGSHKVCYPKHCCKGLQFIHKYPCVMARDAAADYYVYSIAFGKTYTMTIPLLQGSLLSYNSTISSNHSESGASNLRKAERLINGIYTGHYPLPSYLKLRHELWQPTTENLIRYKQNALRQIRKDKYEGTTVW
jgi:hypothetical protein